MDLSNENIIHQKKNGIEYLQFRKLLQYQELIHCYTLKTNDFDVAGNDTYKDKIDMVHQNYNKLSNALELQKQTIIRPYQNHTNIVKSIGRGQVELNNVDGLTTDIPNITFSLTYADCTPLYLYDPVKKVIR